MRSEKARLRPRGGETMNKTSLSLAVLCAAAMLGMPYAQSAYGAETRRAVNGVPSMEKFQEVSDIVLDKCMACHSRDYDLPFYAKIPGIRQIIEQDYRDGLRAMDLNQELVGAAKDRIPNAEIARMSTMPSVMNMVLKMIFLMGMA